MDSLTTGDSTKAWFRTRGNHVAGYQAVDAKSLRAHEGQPVIQRFSLETLTVGQPMI